MLWRLLIRIRARRAGVLLLRLSLGRCTFSRRSIKRPRCGLLRWLRGARLSSLVSRGAHLPRCLPTGLHRGLLLAGNTGNWRLRLVRGRRRGQQRRSMGGRLTLDGHNGRLIFCRRLCWLLGILRLVLVEPFVTNSWVCLWPTDLLLDGSGRGSNRCGDG